MVAWALAREPFRLIDPGCGSGRFAAEAVRRDRSLHVIAIDSDPLATLACRAALATLGAENALVINADFTTFNLDSTAGRTIFVGNPPYVRHHELTPEQKQRAKRAASRLGFALSGLAGLHVHFFLSAFEHLQDGDLGCFITSAEWLDVSYGKTLRGALVDKFGPLSMHLLNPEAIAFHDAMTTAVITCFAATPASPLVRIQKLESPGGLGDLNSDGRVLSRSELRRTSRWSVFFREPRAKPSEELIPLREIARVSRGAVTGANGFFVLEQSRAASLGLGPYTIPVLHRASEVFTADGVVHLDKNRRVLLDPPRSTDLTADEHRALDRYLSRGERENIPSRYICSHRSPWWRIGARAAPIVATYMARQAPAFAWNPDGLVLLNVLHGLYPKLQLDEEQIFGLVAYLNAHRREFRGKGRTYQGGLEKFEPTEMEALLVPPPEHLRRFAT